MVRRLRLRSARLAAVLVPAALGWLLLFGLVPSVSAQAGTITGTVVEAKSGRLLVDAVVGVQGTAVRVVTNVRGQFTLTGLTGSTAQITAQRVGFLAVTRQAPVGGSPVRIELTELAVKLDELVVTGTVGEATSRSLGNTIGKVDVANTVVLAPPTKLQDMLSVNVPGVRVVRAAGSVGSGGITRIRGTGSLSLSNEPLLYIDGVRVYNEAAVATAGFQNFSGESPSRINDLNPEEIESIEVLKGPSAATIYGTEASNGVIQVITKRGRAGRPVFETHAASGFTWLQDPEGRYPSAYYMDHDGSVKEHNVQTFRLSKGYPAIFSTGVPVSLGGSVSGGTERITYLFSADFNREEGYVSYNSQNKYNARANLSYRSTNDKFKIDLSLGTLRSATHSAQAFQPITTSIVWACVNNSCRPDQANPSTTGFNDPNGGRGFTFYRPEDYAETNAYDYIDRTNFSAKFTHQPFSWLQHHLTVGPDFVNNNSENLVERHADSRRPFFSASNGQKVQGENRTTYLTIDYGASATWQPTAGLTSTSSVGTQYYYKQLASLYGEGLIFAIPGPGNINGAAQRSASESFLENKTFGVYVQEQLGWKNRRFFTAALRGDGNSAFGKSFKAVYYPKFSLSWVISEEPFLANKSWIPQLKIRSAWGKAGQQPDVFSALRTYQAKVGHLGSGVVTPQNFGNADLKPEVGQEFEVGFDAGLLNQRVGIEFTYYDKKINDAILNIPLKPSGGFPGYSFVNIGQTRNKGIELAVDVSPVAAQNLGLDLRFTIAKNDSKITSMGGLPPAIATWASQYNVEGFAPASFFLKRVVSATVVKVAKEVPTATNIMCEGGTDLGAGNGAVVPCADAPRIYRGNPTPSWSGSGSATLTISKRLRLLALVDYLGGSTTDVGDVGFGHLFFLNSKSILTGDDPILTGYYGLLQSGYGGAGDAAGLFNSGFARLRTVSASYQLPAGLTRWVGASQGSFTVSGENLAFLWRAQTEGHGTKWIDPEIHPNFAGDVTGSQGYAQESFAQAARIRMSLRFTF